MDIACFLLYRANGRQRDPRGRQPRRRLLPTGPSSRVDRARASDSSVAAQAATERLTASPRLPATAAPGQNTRGASSSTAAGVSTASARTPAFFETGSDEVSVCRSSPDGAAGGPCGTPADQRGQKRQPVALVSAGRSAIGTAGRGGPPLTRRSPSLVAPGRSARSDALRPPSRTEVGLRLASLRVVGDTRRADGSSPTRRHSCGTRAFLVTSSRRSRRQAAERACD